MKRILILAPIVTLIAGCSSTSNKNQDININNALNTIKNSSTTNTGTITTKEETEEITLSDEDYKSYISSYQNPFAIHIRKALNGYLDGSNSGMDMPKTTIEQQNDNGAIYGLSAFDKSYYKSKFIVWAINEHLGGGLDIDIIFQDKPDKMFSAWVYKLGGGEYDLRMFWDKGLDKEEIDKIVKEYKKYIFNKEYSL
jgi:hypothetical protein